MGLAGLVVLVATLSALYAVGPISDLQTVVTYTGTLSGFVQLWCGNYFYLGTKQLYYYFCGPNSGSMLDWSLSVRLHVSNAYEKHYKQECNEL